jgi:hypothetical protein
MMRALVRICSLIFFGLSSSAQELVFSEPIKLSSNVNSEDEELGIVLSSDGKTMYFSRAFHDKNTGGKYAGTDIWMSKKDDEGNWMPAANVGRPWNNKQSNSVIGINQDNTVVYLLNAYSNKSGIAFSKLINGTWSDPEVISIPGINRNDFVGFYVNPAFDVILISMKGADSFGEEDLYVSLKDASEKWMEPKNLGPTINTKGFEISPFLSSDKKRLFFSSNGHPGLGDADIFVAERLYDSWDVWTTPRNAGDKVNSSSFDAYFTSRGDTVGLFTTGKTGNSEIFSVAMKSLKVAERVLTKLSPEALEGLFGKQAFFLFEFEKDFVSLNPSQQEMLWYLVTKVSSLKNTSLELRVVEEFRPDLTNIRLKSINDLIRTTGIESFRVSVPDMKALIKSSNKTIVELVFLKDGY